MRHCASDILARTLKSTVSALTPPSDLIMKVILFALLFTLASAMPQAPSAAQQEPLEEEPTKVIEILRDDRTQPDAGAYSFAVETENGISQREEGRAGSKGQSNVQGSYRYILEDGTVAEVKYIADEFGFQVQSPLLPVAPAFPHPIPQYVLDQIAFAEEQRRLRAEAEAQTKTQAQAEAQSQE